jgi:hypothetical protein
MRKRRNRTRLLAKAQEETDKDIRNVSAISTIYQNYLVIVIISELSCIDQNKTERKKKWNCFSPLSSFFSLFAPKHAH